MKLLYACLIGGTILGMEEHVGDSHHQAAGDINRPRRDSTTYKYQNLRRKIFENQFTETELAMLLAKEKQKSIEGEVTHENDSFDNNNF